MEAYQPLKDKFDVETFVEPDWNNAIETARGRIVLLVLDRIVSADLRAIYKIMEKFESSPNAGCVSTSGGFVLCSDDGDNKVEFKRSCVEVSMGRFFAFSRKRALLNGLYFMDEPNEQIRLADFSMQMQVWGGGNNYSISCDPVRLSQEWNRFNYRWGYFCESL